LSEKRSYLQGLVSRIAALVLVIVLLSAGWAGYWYLGPFQAYGAETFVEVEHGMSSRSIAQELARRGVVRSPWAFLLVRLIHPTAKLQAGEYRFGAMQTPFQVFDKIRKGQIFYEDFTVPEGSNIFDIANSLRNGDTVKAADFLRAAADTRPIHDLDPIAPSLEGYLFPSTYRVTHRTTARQLCRMMTDEFRKQWSQLTNRTDSSELHRVVTLASLVEKETAISGERPLVAAVFFNRLRLDIPLQCDPTTVYAALRENRFSGVIHKSDLASADPYNTYAHAGLPPGPICNPGLLAIKAALTPAPTNYLYFVAKPDGSGSHQFSASLAEHEKAVLAYRHSPVH
jgi:UPF0755 protein